MKKRKITKAQMRKLKEIERYLLETSMELHLQGYDTNDEDAEINQVLKNCKFLIERLG